MGFSSDLVRMQAEMKKARFFVLTCRTHQCRLEEIITWSLTRTSNGVQTIDVRLKHGASYFLETCPIVCKFVYDWACACVTPGTRSIPNWSGSLLTYYGARAQCSLLIGCFKATKDLKKFYTFSYYLFIKCCISTDET